jgi:hypothetical protein
MAARGTPTLIFSSIQEAAPHSQLPMWLSAENIFMPVFKEIKFLYSCKKLHGAKLFLLS